MSDTALVFCEACVHYRPSRLRMEDDGYGPVVTEERCAVAVSPGRVATYRRMEEAPPPTPAEKNATNDCRDFTLSPH